MFNFPVARKHRLENIFDEFFAPVKFGPAEFGSLPAVDIYEKGNTIAVRAEIPGVKPEELEVSVDDGLLTISGEKKQENEVKEKDYYRLEATYGRFERTLRLPEAVKAEGAKAEYKNGVLRIKLQKSEDSRRKKINIDIK